MAEGYSPDPTRTGYDWVVCVTCREMGNALGMNLTADKIATHITSSGTPDPEM